MIHIIDKKSCAGCTACMASCHQNAISMVLDEQGFKYPVVNQEKCTDCGLCDKVCPFDKPQSAPPVQETYAVKHKDALVLKNSTSGGIFTAISDYVLKNGGVVYGAAFDDDMVVRHLRATSSEQRNKMRGSKYVQSDLGDVFLQVKNDLHAKHQVLFTGTPCQIAGLKSYLGNKYSGLICLDLICHGVPSPLIYNEHLKLLSKKLHTTITDYKFRPKDWGWHVHKESVYGKKRKYHSTPYTDLWKSLYYSRVITRASCNNCPYSSLNRPGDITIGDCRGIDNVISDFGSYEGVTLAIVNTETGREIFEKIADNITYQPLNIEDVMQPPLQKSSRLNKYSEKFFLDYTKHGYKKAIVNYYGALYPVKYYVKKLLKRN